MGYLTGQRQREASARALPSLCLLSAEVELPSCVLVEGGLDTGVCEGSEFAENPFKLWWICSV